MKKRWEIVSPGVVIGFVASLLAYDMRCAGPATDKWVVYFWMIGFWAPFTGCLWVRQKTRAEGRGIARSLVITLVMGAISGTFVFPIIGTIYGLVFTAIFVLPPTLWIAALSLAGFRRSREGSFARTIWWRRRWHATIAMCAGAIAVRLHMAPATPYSVGLGALIAAIAALCLLSLRSMAAELAALTDGLAPVATIADSPPPSLDLGVGDAIYAAAIPTGEAPYRRAELTSVRAVGDLAVVRAMMRHTLWGAIAMVVFATTTFAVAGLSLYAR